MDGWPTSRTLTDSGRTEVVWGARESHRQDGQTIDTGTVAKVIRCQSLWPLFSRRHWPRRWPTAATTRSADHSHDMHSYLPPHPAQILVCVCLIDWLSKCLSASCWVGQWISWNYACRRVAGSRCHVVGGRYEWLWTFSHANQTSMSVDVASLSLWSDWNWWTVSAVKHWPPSPPPIQTSSPHT